MFIKQRLWKHVNKQTKNPLYQNEVILLVAHLRNRVNWGWGDAQLIKHLAQV